MMKPEWILVGNAATARLLQRNSAQEPLLPLETLQHPESRMKSSDLGDDRPGHEATDNSAGGNRFEPRSDPKRKEHHKFAVEIAHRLDAGLAAGSFGSLALFASNPFLGELKAALSPAVRERVQLTVDSDYSALGLSELEQRVREHDTRR